MLWSMWEFHEINKMTTLLPLRPKQRASVIIRGILFYKDYNALVSVEISRNQQNDHCATIRTVPKSKHLAFTTSSILAYR